MVKNLPSNAGDRGLIPGQGTRSHMHATTKRSHATTKEPMSHNQEATDFTGFHVCHIVFLKNGSLSITHTQEEEN